jgi:predicted nucleic acid-binding protein
VNNNSLVQLLRGDLGAGEAEAIVLAKEIGADVLLMDERLGRVAAERLRLRVTGIVGVLLEARRAGLVADPVALAQRLRHEAGFWISDGLMKLLR